MCKRQRLFSFLLHFSRDWPTDQGVHVSGTYNSHSVNDNEDEMREEMWLQKENQKKQKENQKEIRLVCCLDLKSGIF